MDKNSALSKDVLKLDCSQETEKIVTALRRFLSVRLKRRGTVVAISGGVDSSVCAALCVRAIGKDRVVGLQMPEKHSSDETAAFSDMVADHLGIEKVYEDITGILDAVGFYKKYDDAVCSVIHEYGTGWRSKLITPNVIEKKGFTVFSIVAKGPDGKEIKKRLPLKAYLGIVAATNFKQRTRKMLEYYHADRLNYAVIGTPNRLEYDQGFFVKYGDGAADIKPIAHLYKTQVYQLAEYLGIPEEIIARIPTTDTYSLPQGQDEFYFSLPYDKMDICLYAKNNNVDPEITGRATGLTRKQVRRMYDDIDQKRSTTQYLHLPALLVDKVTEVG
ncbi:MAG: NAD(+) synthase [Deltaproteobacteria bacterium]|nr:NAD(+) synthase [Deltaproteobacteria bacterium]